MKKFKIALALLICVSFMPSFMAYAEEATNELEETIIEETTDTVVDDNFNLTAGEDVTTENDINGSSIIFGNDVTSTNNVKGIDMLFGRNVNHKGNSDYALLAGDNVTLEGKINNDGLVLGNIITFDESVIVERDLFVFANSVTINGTINRDITIYASTVNLENAKISGDVKIVAATVNISEETVIEGVLSYNEDAEATVSNVASIGSTTLTEKINEEVSFQQKVWSFIVNYCGSLVIFVAIALIVPALFKRIKEKNSESKFIDILSTLGFGALGLVAVPVLFILLCRFSITVPLALLVLALYVLLICLSGLFTGYLYGYLIWKKFIKKEENVLLIGLIGISLNTVILAIPAIGELFSVISLMLGMGILLQLFKKSN